MAKIKAVLEHRRALAAARTLLLHHVGDQIAKLPTEVRDQLDSGGKIESRLRRLEHIDPATAATPSGAYRLEWLQDFIDTHRAARRQIRRVEQLIDELGTTLRDEASIGPIAAATLVCEVGDPRRFDRESRFARWCGTGAVALSSGEGSSDPVKHRLGFRGNRRINSVHLHRVGHPATQPAQSGRLPRPKSRRGQDPARSPTSPQTTTRQPRHPTNAARRKHQITTSTDRHLTRERLTHSLVPLGAGRRVHDAQQHAPAAPKLGALIHQRTTWAALGAAACVIAAGSPPPTTTMPVPRDDE